jgi:hypothetical protein
MKNRITPKLSESAANQNYTTYIELLISYMEETIYDLKQSTFCDKSIRLKIKMVV